MPLKFISYSKVLKFIREMVYNHICQTPPNNICSAQMFNFSVWPPELIFLTNWIVHPTMGGEGRLTKKTRLVGDWWPRLQSDDRQHWLSCWRNSSLVCSITQLWKLSSEWVNAIFCSFGLEKNVKMVNFPSTGNGKIRSPSSSTPFSSSLI